MTDERTVTRADMEAAGERIAERDGVTVEEVRERIRRVDAAERSRAEGSAQAERSNATSATERSPENANDASERTCLLEDCDRTFVPTNARHRYCSTSHRAAAFRARNGGAP